MQAGAETARDCAVSARQQAVCRDLDPTHLQALDEVKFQTNQAVEPVVVDDDKLARLVKLVSDAADNTMR